MLVFCFTPSFSIAFCCECGPLWGVEKGYIRLWWDSNWGVNKCTETVKRLNSRIELNIHLWLNMVLNKKEKVPIEDPHLVSLMLHSNWVFFSLSLLQWVCHEKKRKSTREEEVGVTLVHIPALPYHICINRFKKVVYNNNTVVEYVPFFFFWTLQRLKTTGLSRQCGPERVDQCGIMKAIDDACYASAFKYWEKWWN